VNYRIHQSILCFCFCFLSITSIAFGQEDPAVLSAQLTAGKITQLEKVTSIFKWITDNISYKPRRGNKVIGPASFRNFYEDNEEDGPLKPVDERVSITVLKKRVAVCDGYARLFKTLCGYAGIRAEIIEGYARGGISKNRFAVNHTWNAVLIEDKWYLLDATWASGYLSLSGDEFVKDYDPLYFLAPPAVFFRDHYPDDLRWTLMDDKIVPEEFKRSPYKQKSFTKYSIKSFSPATGILNVNVGDTIRLKLETAKKERDMNICPDLLVDSAIYSYSPSWVFLRPDPDTKSNEFQYTFNVTSTQVEWLYLLYNDDMVLRYKVNIRKQTGN
jgi:transglutaminase/protease-like cytokinesis protein 3